MAMKRRLPILHRSGIHRALGQSHTLRAGLSTLDRLQPVVHHCVGPVSAEEKAAVMSRLITFERQERGLEGVSNCVIAGPSGGRAGPRVLATPKSR